MTNRVTTTELAERLADIIEIVHTRGERFVVERNGKPLVTIVPSGDAGGITWSEFVTRLAQLPRPDDKFADDLEEIQREMNRNPVEPPEWPS